MKFLNTLNCTISTLSPVHIGCGEDYYPTNYVIDDGLLHHFSEEALLKSLNVTELNNLVKLVNEADEDTIRKIQSDIYDKKDQLKNHATNAVVVSKGLANFYKSRIGKTSQHEAGNKKVNHKLEIARHAFNSHTQIPYFAGSSIKGAIRTALLKNLNQWDNLRQVCNDLEITDEQGRRFYFDKNKEIANDCNKKLQKNLLNYQDIEEDPFRLLKISDAPYQHPDNLHSLEIRFAVNCQKEKIRLPVIFEYVAANRSRSLNFSINFLKNCRWGIQKIAEVCNEFFLPQFENELELLEKYNYANSGWLKSINTLLKEELREALNTNQAFLLRIGQHGGAESHTLENLRHIHLPQLKQYGVKPTSIWLSADNHDSKTNLLPFGWILVEIGDTHLKKTAEFLTQQCCELYPSYKQQIDTKKRTEKEQLEKELALAELERKSNMTNIDFIAELRTEFQKSTPQNQPVSGTLNPKLTTLINQAVNWSTEDKKALFDLGTEINQKLWSNNKKVKERLKTLQNQ